MKVFHFVENIIVIFLALLGIYVTARVIFEAWFKTKKQNTGGGTDNEEQKTE